MHKFLEQGDQTGVIAQKAAQHRSALAAATQDFAASFGLLRTRQFGTFCFASLLSNLGTWAQQVAEPWLLLTLGASSFLIGLDAFAMAAPVWLLTLVGGVLADRTDRRRMIALFQTIQMFCPITLVGLLIAHVVQPWMIIVLSAIVGITDALSMPSFTSIVPSIVERSQIASALALNSTQFNLSRILGPALAGILMASVGAIACFALNAVSYLPFIWVAIWILPRRPQRTAEEPFARRHFFSGIGEIAHQPQLRGALLTVLFTSVLCGPLVVFSPVLVKNVLHREAGDFSLVMGAFGAGGMLGALALLGVGPGRDRNRLSSWFAVGYGTILVLVALNPTFWGLPALLAAAGIAMTISNTSANSLLQSTALPHLRGQTASLFMLAMRGGLSVGSLLTGLSVSAVGVREAILINGALAIVVQLAIGGHWRRSTA